MITIKKGSKRIENVDVASGLLDKVLGLMFRNPGRLLMKFSREGRYSIWMPFMRFSLDLVFIDKSKRIVDIKKNVKPISLNPKTWKVYFPKRKCLFVLEVEGGLTKKLNLKVEDMLVFQS